MSVRASNSKELVNRKNAFRLLLFLLLCLSVLSCASDPKMQFAGLAGKHRFLVSCPLKTQKVVVSIGKNAEDARVRLAKIEKEYAYCKRDYLGYETGTQGDWASLSYSEEEKLRLEKSEAEARKRLAKLQAEQLEKERRKQAIRGACEDFGFVVGSELFAVCVKDVSLAIQKASLDQQMALELRSEIAGQGQMNRQQARWNAIFQSVVNTNNANRIMQNQNANTQRIISNDNLNSNRSITCLTNGNRTTCQ